MDWISIAFASLVNGRAVSASGSRFSLSVSLSLCLFLSLSLFLYLFVFLSSPFSLLSPSQPSLHFLQSRFVPRLS